MPIGEKIKYYRKTLGLTQTELGERLGVKKNAVSKWECGRVDDIPGSKVKQMAELFDVPVSYLIDDEQLMSVSDSDLDDELVALLTSLTPEEVTRVTDFISGLIANRKDD